MLIPTTILGQAASSELSYVEFTAPVTISAATEGTADTVVTAAALTFDGATRVRIEFFSDFVSPGATAGSAINICIYDGASSIGFLWSANKDNSGTGNRGVAGCMAARYLTPSAGSHTYSIRAFRATSNGTVDAGVGGTGASVPGYVRITKEP